MARNRDVNLIIRARDEASKTLRNISRAVREVKTAAREFSRVKTGAAFSELVKQAKTLQQVGGKEAQKDLQNLLTRSRQAFSRASQGVKEAAAEVKRLQEELASAQTRAKELSQALERVRRARDKTRQRASTRGSEAEKLRREYKELTKAVERAAKAQAELPASIEKSKAKLAELKQRYRELGREISRRQREGGAEKTLARLQERQAKVAVRRREELAKLRSQQAALLNARRYQPRYEQERQDVARRLRNAERAHARATRRLDALAKKEEILAQQVKAAEKHLKKLPASIESASAALKENRKAARAAGAEYSEFRRRATRALKGIVSAQKELADAEKLRLTTAKRQLAVSSAQELKEQRQEAQRLREVWKAYEEQIKRTAVALRAAGADQRKVAQATAKMREQAVLAKQAYLATREGAHAFAQQRRFIPRAEGLQELEQVAARMKAIRASVRDSIKAFQQAARGGAVNLAAPVRGSVQAFQRLRTAVRETAHAFRAVKPPVSIARNALRAMGLEVRQTWTLFQRLRSQVVSLAAAYVGFQGVFGAFRNVADAQRQMDRALNRLASVTEGNMRAARVELQNVLAVSKRLGLEFGRMAQEYTKFALATKGTALEGRKTQRIFENIAIAARVAGLSQQQVELTFVALSQIASKGVVQMEELRRQLGDHIPGAVKIMADALGYGQDHIKQFYDDVRKGLITADALLPFSERLRKIYEGQLPAALQTTEAAIGRLKNQFFLALKSIGEKGATQGIVDFLNELSTTLRSSEAQALFQTIADGMRGVLGVLQHLIRYWRAYGTVLSYVIGLGIGRRLFRLYRFLRRDAPGLMRTVVTWRLLSRALTRFRSVAQGTGSVLRGLAAAVRVLPGPFKALVVVLPLLAAAWFRAATAARRLDEAIASHEKVMQRVSEAYSAAAQDIDKFAEAMKKADGTALKNNYRDQKQALADLRQELKKTVGTTATLGEAIDKMGVSIAVPVWGDIVALRLDAKLGRVQAAVRKLVASLQKGKISLEKFKEKLLDLRDATPEAGDYLARVRKAAEAYVAQKERLQQAKAALEAHNGEVNKATLNTLGLVDSQREAELASQRFQAAMRKLKAVMGGAKDASDGVSDAFGKQSKAVSSLTNQLKELAKAYEIARKNAQTPEEAAQATEAFRKSVARLKDISRAVGEPIKIPLEAQWLGASKLPSRPQQDPLTPLVNNLGRKAGPAWNKYMTRLVAATKAAARELKIPPSWLLGVFSYETRGTFKPWIAGPRTKWGQHRGLIQWGEPQARQYGVSGRSSVEWQVAQVVKYLRDLGFDRRKGHGLAQLYAAINAGGVNKLRASDAAAGGRPGDVLWKVKNDLPAHLRKAERALAQFSKGVSTTVESLAKTTKTAKATAYGKVDPAAIERMAAAQQKMTAEQRRMVDGLSAEEKAVLKVIQARGQVTGGLKKQIELARQYAAIMSDAEKRRVKEEARRIDAAVKQTRTIETNLKLAREQHKLDKLSLVERKTAQALAEAEKRAREHGLVLTEKQRQQIRETIRLRYEGQQAAKRAREEAKAAQVEAQAAEARINQLMLERQRVLRDLRTASSNGDEARVEELRSRLKSLTDEIATQRKRLTDAQLLAAEKQAEATAREKNREVDQRALEVARQRIRVTAQQRAEEERLYFLKTQLQVQEERVNELIARRQQLAQQYQIAEQQGDFGRMATLAQQAQEVNAALEQAAQTAAKFYRVLGGPEANAGILRMQTVVYQAQNFKGLGEQTYFSWKQVSDLFVNRMTSAFDEFAQAVAQGKNIGEAARRAFLRFASDFLRQIAQMIIKQALFNALRGFTLGGGFGGGGFFGRLFGAGHSGGLVGAARIGTGNPVRRVAPEVFAVARRFHAGGIVGLAPNEVPAILKRGEEVLTANDPRHILNQAAAASAPASNAPVNVKVVNTFDPGEFVSEGLDSPDGQQAILNFIRANPAAVKQALEGS